MDTNRYASDTTVSAEKSRAEIERTLARYGAEQFMYAYNRTQAVIQFTTATRQVRFILPLPDRGSREFTHTPGQKRPRSPEARDKAWEQGCRQAWRALALAIKAKLEAVAAGIVTFDDEFMAHLVLPNGARVGDLVAPGIETAYTTGEIPPLFGTFPPTAIEP